MALTTKGDLIGHNGTTTVRVPVGNQNGLVLTVNNGATPGIDWEAATGPTNVNYIYMPWGSGAIVSASSLINVSTAQTGANGTNCQSFIPPYTIAPTKMAFRVTGAQAGATCGVAIYTISGATWTKTAAVDEGADCSTNGVKTSTFTAVTLSAGTMYGFCSTSSNAAVTGVGIAQFTATSANALINNYAVRFGTGQNSTAGVLPTTVSAITSASITQWMAVVDVE